jgi:sec-independent protein translocase protein TatA
MFGIGGGEIIFIVFIALMLFGADKLPEAMRTFAKVMAQLKNATNDIKSEISKGMDEHGITDSIKNISSNFDHEVAAVKKSVDQSSGNPVKELTEKATTLKQELDDLTGPIKRQF